MRNGGTGLLYASPEHPTNALRYRESSAASVAVSSAMSQTVRIQAEDRRQRLLALLADGEFQSGEALAQRLSISRGGVWKLVRSLRALGIEVESLPRQGYRLPQSVDLLSRTAVMASVSEDMRPLLESLEVLL